MMDITCLIPEPTESDLWRCPVQRVEVSFPNGVSFTWIIAYTEDGPIVTREYPIEIPF